MIDRFRRSSRLLAAALAISDFYPDLTDLRSPRREAVTVQNLLRLLKKLVTREHSER